MEGSKNRRQQLWAVAEPPHIVVGNPRSLQRIVDLGRLKLNAVSFVVLDEVVSLEELKRGLLPYIISGVLFHVEQCIRQL